MIREAGAEDEKAVLAAMRAVPALGPLCEMHWRLLRQNRHMPHRFYLTDSGAALKLSGRRATLCGVPQTPDEAAEVEDFLAFSRADRLTSMDWHPPGWRLLDDTAVMRRPPDAPLPDFPLPEGFTPEAPVDDVLRVLESTGGRMRPEGVREGFWVDFHIRRNHGYSKVYGIWQDGLLASTAGAYAVLKDAACIACVETLPACRHRGYATALVARLCADLPGRALSLMCADGMCGFYARLGFEKTGRRGFICENPAA